MAAAVLVGVYFIFSTQKATEEMAPVNQAETGTAPKTGGVTSGGAPIPSTGKVQVDIKGFSFVSPTVRIAPGTTIIWKNFDDAPHSVIGPDFSSPVLQKGQTYSHKFTKEGTFSYYCGLHPNMKGEVVVRQF